MALWRIIPAARRDDPAWLTHPVWDDVIVRAPTAAFARLVAARMEENENPDRASVGNESSTFKSAFESEKLYHVRPLPPGDAREDWPTDGESAVLRASGRSAANTR